MCAIEVQTAVSATEERVSATEERVSAVEERVSGLAWELLVSYYWKHLLVWEYAP